MLLDKKQSEEKEQASKPDRTHILELLDHLKQL